MFNELSRKQRGQPLHWVYHYCQMKSTHRKRCLSGWVMFLDFSMKPLVFTWKNEVPPTWKSPNLQLCDFSMIAAEATPDHQIQACLCLLAGGVFPLSISLQSRGPWITVSMFSLSALFEREVLYLARKACHRLPAVCHFRQREHRLPHLLEQPREFSRDPGHMLKLYWRRNVLHRHQACLCPAESTLLRLYSLTVRAVACDGPLKSKKL